MQTKRRSPPYLANYQDALNQSNTDAVMPLYTEDGVFMPPYSQSAVGAAAVRQAYDAVFKAIKLRVKFNVAEAVEMAPDWAIARTNSAGRSRFTGRERRAPKRTRSSSFSGRTPTGGGRSRATASPPPIRRRSSKSIAPKIYPKPKRPWVTRQRQSARAGVD
jgi:ketosteroid isomerase-like protein